MKKNILTDNDLLFYDTFLRCVIQYYVCCCVAMVQTTTFSPQISIPGGFEVVLRDFTREVLRDQPEDIDAYAVKYFSKKLVKPVVKVTPVSGEKLDKKLDDIDVLKVK